MKWIKASELPKENGLYVCQTIKVKNGEKSNAVTYGEFRIGYKSIKVDDEMYGEVVEWLDESAPVDDGVDLREENAQLKKRVEELEADVDKLLNLCRRKY